MKSARKYIAWLDGFSVAVGATPADVERDAVAIFMSPNWQAWGKPCVTLRITTYGQKEISTRALVSAHFEEQ